MELHVTNLNAICRVCGGPIKSNPKYRNPKSVCDFMNELKASSDVSIEDEDKNVYPKLFCHQCYHKFYKIKKEKKTVVVPVASFSPHNSEDCQICYSYVDIPSSSGVGGIKPLRLKEMDKVLEDINFTKSFKTDTYLRVYSQNINEICIFVNHDYTWKCIVYGSHKLPLESHNLPILLKYSNLSLLVEFFNKYKLCQGVSGFSDVLQQKIEIRWPFKDSGVNVESENHKTLLNPGEYSIFRKANCKLFTDGKNNSCKICWDFAKNNLWRARSRLSGNEPEKKRQRTSDTSNTNVKHLSREELVERLQNAQKVKRDSIKKLTRLLTSLVAKNLEVEGIELDSNFGDICQQILKESTGQMFPEDSPQWLLWQQQKEFASKSDTRGMRWHPLIIRWCLSIYNLSPASYQQMSSKRLNFLRLPNVGTLRKYTDFTKPSSGFNSDIISCLIEDSNLKNLKEWQKHVALSFDEMKIKSDVVYQRSTGQMVGFTEIGDINSEFDKYRRDIEDNSDDLSDRDFATDVIVYMVRGLFTGLQQSFGYFATHGISDPPLYPCTMEAIRVLSSIGFNVRSITSDGLDDQDISWRHILELYEEDLGITSDSSCSRFPLGLRKMHKLCVEHVKKTPRSRMTFKLAAQVLSQTTSNALRSQAIHDTKSTAKFIEMFDKVFDCLNVSNFNKERYGKAELNPYKSPDDERFKFLKEDFLDGFLGRWKKQVDEMIEMKPDPNNRLPLLSRETLQGWHLTVNSFVDLTQELLQMEGVKYFLSEKLSQDPLEEYFSFQRRKGGGYDNPTLDAMERQFITINLMKSNLISELTGNTREREQGSSNEIDITDSLPKKK